jgi:aquaporin Z
VLHAKGQTSLSAAAVAPGLTVVAVILFTGAVSGAHLNPVVSVAFALRRDFPEKRVPGYILAQMTGATLATLFLPAVSEMWSTLAPRCRAGLPQLAGIAARNRTDGGPVGAILGTASRAQNVGSVGALGVGGYVAPASGLPRSAGPR